MTFHFFALKGHLRRAPVGTPKCNCTAADLRSGHDQVPVQAADTRRARMVAVWRVNGETGRLECSWKAEGEPGIEGGLRSWIERTGLLLAVYQQGRFAA